MGAFNSNLGSVYVEVGADLSALTKDLQGAVQDATQAGQQIGTALESGINQNSGPAAANLSELGSAASGASGDFKDLGSSLGEIAKIFGIGLGITEGIESLKAFAEESIDAYGKIQLATVALTALTGSAETAKDTLEAMKGLALGSIFSLPELDQAAQKMAAIGVAAASIPSAMKAVIDAAEGTGNSMDNVASSLDRIYLSATIMPRTLATLGISVQDLADTMGISANQVKDAFQAMGPQSDDALQILQATIERRMGAAGDAVKGTLPNAINAVKVQWDTLLEDFGEKAAGPFTEALNHISQLEAAFDALLKSMSGGTETKGSTLMAIIGDVTWATIIGTVNKLSESVGVLTGKYGSMAEAAAVVNAQVDLGTKNQIAQDAALAASIVAEGEQQAKTEASAQVARDALAAKQALAQMEADLTEATKLSGEAEKSLAENRKALVIPSIWDEEAASSALVGAQAFLKQANLDEQAVLQALNAERAKASPNLQTLEDLEAQLAVASKTSADARDDVKTAEQNLTTARGAAKTAASELAQTEQAHAAFLKATGIPAVQDYATALAAVNEAKAQAATDDAALTAAQNAYNEALKGGDPAAVAAATLTLQEARRTLKTDTDEVRLAEQNLNAVQNDGAKIAKALLDGNSALQVAYTKFSPTIKDLDSQLQGIQKDQVTLTQAESDEYDALANLQAAKDAGLTQGIYVDQQLAAEKVARDTVAKASSNLSAAIQQLSKDYGISYASAKLLVDLQNSSVSEVTLLADAYAAAGIQTTAALQAEEVAAEAAYTAIVKDPTADLSQKLSALQNEVNKEIALNQTVPADQQLQLAKMTQQEQDYIANSAKRWTDLSNTIHNDMQGLFSGLITDLFTGGDFVKTMEDALQKIGESIVSAIFKPFTDLISQTVASLVTPLAKTLAGWISDALTAIFPSLAGALGGAVGGVTTAAAVTANTAAITANTAALAALTAALGGAAGTSAASGAASAATGGGGAASSIGSGISGISGIVTAVSTSISAVTGLLNMFGVGNSGDQVIQVKCA